MHLVRNSAQWSGGSGAGRRSLSAIRRTSCKCSTRMIRCPRFPGIPECESIRSGSRLALLCTFGERLDDIGPLRLLLPTEEGAQLLDALFVEALGVCPLRVKLFENLLLNARHPGTPPFRNRAAVQFLEPECCQAQSAYAPLLDSMIDQRNHVQNLTPPLPDKRFWP